MTKDVVILTKSTKRGGYCVAGLDAGSGEWVRLVSPEVWSHGALTDENMTCTDGSCCGPLDLVRVQIQRAEPLPRQPENMLIDVKKKFEKRGAWDLQSVLRLHPGENPETVYGNTEHFLTEELISSVDRSLLLIHTDWIRIRQWLGDAGKTKTKANFRFKGQWYNNISVTDPEFYQVEDQTTYTSAYLVISLPDVPFDNGQYYKFIAKIFIP